ncbi:Gluconeogenesis factor [Anoxybacillus sp. BCO1]|nr:Gluconeogenesis factor [Anoxybacillus sp. BCO1]
MTQAGETLNYTASDHVKALYDHMACAFLDAIIVNDAPILPETKERYAKELAAPVVCDTAKLEALGLQVICDAIIDERDGTVRHDTKKVAALLLSLLAPPSHGTYS